MFQMRRRFAYLVWAALLVLSAAASVQAQTPSKRPLAVADVSTYGEKQDHYLVAFSADGQEAGRLPYPKDAQQMTISGDGQWITAAGYDPQTQAQWLDYRRVNGRPIPITVEKGFMALPGEFSTDSRYLMYTLYSYDPPAPRWILGIVELASGQKIEFTGEVNFDTQNQPDALPGAPIAFDFDGAKLLFFAIPIGTEGYPLGVYSIDVPALNGSRSALPPVKTLRKKNATPPLQRTLLSPDGAKLAYMFNDPANPPANFQGEGPQFTVNGLGIFDLKTSEDRVVARAGKGQALEALAWSPTNDFVIFTGGSYRQSSQIISPQLYSVNVATGLVTNTPPIMFSDNPNEGVLDVLACSSGLFYVTQSGSDQNRVVTLYTSPLKDPGAGKKLLGGTQMFIQLQKCVPPLP